jgi:hypothetical protein
MEDMCRAGYVRLDLPRAKGLSAVSTRKAAALKGLAAVRAFFAFQT